MPKACSGSKSCSNDFLIVLFAKAKCQFRRFKPVEVLPGLASFAWSPQRLVRGEIFGATVAVSWCPFWWLSLVFSCFLLGFSWFFLGFSLPKVFLWFSRYPFHQPAQSHSLQPPVSTSGKPLQFETQNEPTRRFLDSSSPINSCM